MPQAGARQMSCERLLRSLEDCQRKHPRQKACFDAPSRHVCSIAAAWFFILDDVELSTQHPRV